MPKLVGLDTYADLPRPNVDWIIHGLIPRPSIIMLLGEPKIGKSFLALQMALAIAQGTSFMGHKAYPNRVFYIQLDTSELVWRHRLINLRDSGVSLSGPVYMIHPEDQPSRTNITNQEHYKAFKAAIDECNPAIVILDVLREVHCGDEQDSTQMKIVGDALSTLCQGRCLFTLHHPRKPSADTGAPISTVNATRGSSYLAGKVDALWLIHGGHLHIESRFNPGEKVKLERTTNGLWRFPVVEYQEKMDHQQKVAV